MIGFDNVFHLDVDVASQIPVSLGWCLFVFFFHDDSLKSNELLMRTMVWMKVRM
jgi:hypothetical protein